MIYKFVPDADMSKIVNTELYALHQRMEAVGDFKKLTSEEKERLSKFFTELWNPEAYNTGKVRLMGFVFDFTPWMKTYVVWTKYDGLKEIKSFNKTLIRANATYPSHIERIMEVPPKR